jgi:hypothetical protein
MKKTIWALTLLSVLPIFCFAQDSTSVNQARKDNLVDMLNYRFKGGYYNFEKLFNQKVSYPEVARNNCIIGITILSLTVDCDGTISEVKMKNPLGYGVDETISSFVTETNGHWNKCNDTRYTKIEIPIQFRTKGTITAEDVALFICIGDNPGFVCNDDEYYLKKAKRFIEKGKGKKALEMLDILTKRDPYNSLYYEMKTKAINM